MSEIRVLALQEADWQRYRQLRLEALQESPEAFVATHDSERDLDEDFWRLRMRRAHRFAATKDGATVGVVSLRVLPPSESGEDQDWDEEITEAGEVFGMWTRPAFRGQGVSQAMLDRVVQTAREEGRSHLLYWVGTDNARAVAFASGYGFHPTDVRRPVRTGARDDDGEPLQELVMLLSVR